MRKRESWERGRCESGGADGVRPPLPICAEGGGGTRLLGRRGHSRAQRVGPTLPGSAASLSSTSSPRCLWREKGEAVGRGGERKRRDVVSGGNSKGGVSGPPLPLQPPRPGETQEERNHSHPAPGLPSPCIRHHSAHHRPDPQGQRCTHPLMHTSHPTHHHRPSHRRCVCCLLIQDTPDLHLCPGHNPYPYTTTWCAGTHAYTHHRTHACMYMLHIH